jgi:hypothetical protein
MDQGKRTFRLPSGQLQRSKPHKNIQVWLQLDKGGSGFQLLTEEEIVAVIFFLFTIFTITIYIITFYIYLFLRVFCLLRVIICFIKPGYRLIWMTCSPSPVNLD